LLGKIPERNRLKEGRLILAHGFRGFSPWLAGFTAEALRQGRASGQQHARSSSPHGGQETERDGEEGAGTCMSLVTYFLQPDPIS
jgi:hypothetical protein